MHVQPIEIRYELRARPEPRWPTPVLDAGPYTFDGTALQTRLIPHNPAYELAAGTLTTLVRVDDLTRLQGIVAKDEKDTAQPGHLHLWFTGTSWRARMQGPAGQNHVLEAVGSINKAWHHLATTFGPAGFSFHLDRQEVGRHAAVKLGLDRNTLGWIIGADAQRRVAGTAMQGLAGYLSGTVAWVRLYSEQLTAAEVADLAEDEMAAWFGPDQPFSDGTYFSDGTGWRR